MQPKFRAFLSIPLIAALLVGGCGTSKPASTDGHSAASGGATTADGGGAGGTSAADGEVDSFGAAGSGVAGSPKRIGEGTCASPYVLQGAVTFQSETTRSGASEVSALSSSCLGMETSSPEKVYKIQIPASGPTKLKVTATPTQKPGIDAYDPVVYLTKSCVAHPSCVACKDSRGGGSFESIEYTNGSGAPMDLFIVVDGFDFQNLGGAFNLDVSLSNP